LLADVIRANMQSVSGKLLRAGGALGLLKLYRTGLLAGADLADDRALKARAQHGPNDPVVAVLQEIAKTNRAAKQGLDEFAATVDAQFLAQLHSTAVCVVGATASYAESARHVNLHKFSVSRAAKTSSAAPATLAAVQLVQFWRTCLLYCKLAFVPQ
jgi:hypothetical protein